MKKRTEDDLQSLRWFLEELKDGRCTIELWNEFAIGAYQDAETEEVRNRLYQKALLIGQCAAEPFPPILRHFAETLHDELT